MDALPARLHASLRPEPPTSVHATGEVRLPLSIWAVDELRATADLVMSRGEAQQLFTQLAGALGYVCEVPGPRALEALR
ncbi:hypothetical protein ABZ439_08015 [Streptomyces sp. NPDC005840]|uniref:hypothetical protein n=1 Tax=Streptomyces sp. NPDC005840 TaxID=3157072 RepID=UPI0033D78955